MTTLTLASRALPPGARAMRARIRDFLERTDFTPQVDSWGSAFDAGFSAALGSAGFLGMTWPKAYGGHERSAFDRLVVNEELLAAGAPVAAHWFADRQVGPALLRHGTEEQKRWLLPGMAAGTCCAAIGLSEPGAGSDLAAVRTTAREVPGGWSLTGQKVWTSWAHRSQVIIVLARTSARTDDRHAGLSQLIVELPKPGVTIRPLAQTSGEEHFTEVFFDEAFVPASMVLGEVGGGWSQITGELASERSGAERFLSPMPLLSALAAEAAAGVGSESVAAERVGADWVGAAGAAGVGLAGVAGARPAGIGPAGIGPAGIGPAGADRAVADLVVTSTARLRLLRQASTAIAGLLEDGESPEVEAAIVKDLGTTFESEFVSAALATSTVLPAMDAGQALSRHLGEAALRSPTFSLRGGANDILRGIVAKGAGLR